MDKKEKIVISAIRRTRKREKSWPHYTIKNNSDNGHRKFTGFSSFQAAKISYLLAIAVFVSSTTVMFLQYDSKNLFTADYTYCQSTQSKKSKCIDMIKNNVTGARPIVADCTCMLSFNIKDDVHADKLVYLYYGLENFYQNIRKLVKSRDRDQLAGNENIEQIKCKEFFDYYNKSIYPCGAMANSMFNDEFELYHNETKQPIVLDRYNIALDTDRNNNFKNPSPRYQALVRSTFMHPLHWSKGIFDLDLVDTYNNGLQNGPFIVWMREETFTDFIKLDSIIRGGLKKGTYNIKIKYRFGIFHNPETDRKIFHLVTPSKFGIRNMRFILLSDFVTIVLIVFTISCFYIDRQLDNPIKMNIYKILSIKLKEKPRSNSSFND